MNLKHCSAREVAESIQNEDVIAVSTNGGGMGEPDAILEAIEQRFLSTGQPNRLTLIYSLGFGNGVDSGLNRFAHEGMLKRVIGAHFSWGPKLQELIKADLVEAYGFPAGAVHGLLRETGAGRPGFITHVGLHTFADPRYKGGKSNSISMDDLVEIISIGGQEKLRYLPQPVNVALLRGTFGDHRGNVSFEEEAVYMDPYSVALAAHNNRGKVYSQVRESVWVDSLNPRTVKVPGVMVDGIVEHQAQAQTYLGGYDLSISGQTRRSIANEEPDQLEDPVRRFIARRALKELKAETSVNFGFGIPAGVGTLGKLEGLSDHFWQSVEQGAHNGHMLDGAQFGAVYNAEAIIPSLDQFDYYSGKGLDIAFLGMGEMDQYGNVNVSHLGDKLIGPGGFIDISQNCKKVVFCGTFDSKGNEVAFTADEVIVKKPGKIRKIVEHVKAITFNGNYALSQGQQVIYITERAVFRLTEEGIELTEVAPGISIDFDILPYMEFVPIIKQVKQMDRSLILSLSNLYSSNLDS